MTCASLLLSYRNAKCTINSHIIPGFYLEQFATKKRSGKPGRIWVYEKTKEPDERATRVQGRENGYFSYTEADGSLNESFEQHLAEARLGTGKMHRCLWDLSSPPSVSSSEED